MIDRITLILEMKLILFWFREVIMNNGTFPLTPAALRGGQNGPTIC